ncbi:Protein CBG10647 [Caenorhabditis briggsae]|uniref:Uncharacterized protein n=3 Tax=Caenorhabditis briggsae TaxID=6238 RepID=A0AAE8ZW23_CAEBR|nr:Protein CBG10647 [Caenorhabditis briggsae]ULT85291.1 hypothetical protein L3Y34_013825 [Caenorhabditis briggsae]CAP30000.1 Protein CBG10647 [Caenorhabditis briggsae]
MSTYNGFYSLTAGRQPIDDSFSWINLLHQREKEEDVSFVPLDALAVPLKQDFRESIDVGYWFLTRSQEYDSIHKNKKDIRWFAEVEDMCGFYVLGSMKKCVDEKFWINILSRTVYSRDNMRLEPNMEGRVILLPPYSGEEYRKNKPDYKTERKKIQEEAVNHPSVSDEFDEKKDKLEETEFFVGQRLELLDNDDSSRLHVARIQEIRGRRWRVKIQQEDCPTDLDSMLNESQTEKDGTFWVDEESVFVFPVGFAAINGYNIVAQDDYITHTEKIRDAIKAQQHPAYDPEDIQETMLRREAIPKNLWSRIEEGQKLEFLDPLDAKQNKLTVASVRKVCITHGYVIVSADGDDEETVPIHVMSGYIFPVGYAEKYGMKLKKPLNFRGRYAWNKYLAQEGAVSIPKELTKPVPSQERLDKFEVGAYLEASDMNDNTSIYPARIVSLHGRLVRVSYLGYESSDDAYFDIDSHSLFPIGFSEICNFKLQRPKVE